MRHRDRNRKFGRVRGQCTALVRNLARSLILGEGITTTLAKAKALRPFVEQLITTTKKNTLAARYGAVRKLGGAKSAEQKLRTLAKRYVKRAGGYTRIIKLGRVGKRVGDMARIEFID